MSITVPAKIRNGIIVLNNKLDIPSEDVIIKIVRKQKEPAIKTKINASLELVEEVLELDLDKLL